MMLRVVLVEPEIPWNTGNVGRTCVAAGAELHLVRPLGFSLDSRRLRRAGLDYWRRLAPTVWPSWQAFSDALPGLGEPFFFASDGGRDLWSVDYGERPVLVFGGESRGLPAAVRRQAGDRLVAIPMQGEGVRSLNLSTAAAVAIYEVRRRRRAEAG